jgi:hypothetical protein
LSDAVIEPSGVWTMHGLAGGNARERGAAARAGVEKIVPGSGSRGARTASLNSDFLAS